MRRPQLTETYVALAVPTGALMLSPFFGVTVAIMTIVLVIAKWGGQ